MSQIIHTEPPTLQDPVVRLTYEPSPPVFTIRDIVSAIVSSSSSPFKVTVHKTLSLEDRARLLRAKEKRSLLYRLGFSVILAIPTFIIGVVFMSIVSPQNPTRKFVMEPMWSGNASRLQWSLFFLATPVMFYSAGSFHRRSLKEVHALWRRGSRTPMWKRFLRFGSMNLLVLVSGLGSHTTNETNTAGIVWGLGGIFLLRCLACPCSLASIVPRRSR
jgi:Cu+-exporting ATPase